MALNRPSKQVEQDKSVAANIIKKGKSQSKLMQKSIYLPEDLIAALQLRKTKNAKEDMSYTTRQALRKELAEELQQLLQIGAISELSEEEE